MTAANGERAAPSRVAALWDPTTGASQVAMTQSGARSLNLNIQIVEVRGRDDLAGAFRAAKKERAEALTVFSSPLLASLLELAINVKTARAPGLTVPQSLLWKADRIVD